MWTIQANVVTPNGTIQDGFVTVGDDGCIQHVGSTRDISPQSGDVDGRGFLLLPGFIDLHVHGGGGADFMDGTPDAVRTVLRTHARFGTTGMLATTLTALREDTDSAIVAAHEVMQGERDPTCARLLGVHLEGPYICAAKRGAQPPDFVRDPDCNEFAHWLKVGRVTENKAPLTPQVWGEEVQNSGSGFALAQKDNGKPVQVPVVSSPQTWGAGGGSSFHTIVKRLTLAPELPGARELIEMATAAGVVVSMGHTNATAEQALDAVTWGVRGATHVFNAMPPLHHREPGAVGVALTNLNVACEVICDGVHLHPLTVKLIYRTGVTRSVVLITDAMRGAGMPDGTYRLGGRDVFVKEGTATFDDGTLAGSVLTMNRAFVNFRRFTGWNQNLSARVTSYNAAHQLKIDDEYGSIEVGKQADMVLMHPDTGDVLLTIIGGTIAYER